MVVEAEIGRENQGKEETEKERRNDKKKERNLIMKEIKRGRD